MNDYYGLPSGKVEHDESFEQAAIREAREEIGIEVMQADLKHVLTMHRLEENDTNSWVDVFFEVDKWEGEIVNAEPHMHSELAWLDPETLPKNTIPSVRFAIEQIAAGNAYCEYGWQ
jgi:8-oxo-dGTP diphosphatase